MVLIEWFISILKKEKNGLLLKPNIYTKINETQTQFISLGKKLFSLKIKNMITKLHYT
jgi:hypothetical protein